MMQGFQFRDGWKQDARHLHVVGHANRGDFVNVVNSRRFDDTARHLICSSAFPTMQDGSVAVRTNVLRLRYLGLEAPIQRGVVLNPAYLTPLVRQHLHLPDGYFVGMLHTEIVLYLDPQVYRLASCQDITWIHTRPVRDSEGRQKVFVIKCKKRDPEKLVISAMDADDQLLFPDANIMVGVYSH